MDLPISGLPIAGALSGAELIPLVQTGTTSQSTASALLTYISGSLTATNGLTKTGNNIVWGGALTGNTSISGSYTINFSNSFVGINTATQSAYSERLRVNGPSRFDDTTYISDQGYFTWSPGAAFVIVATTQHLRLATGAAKDIVFINNGTESARIFSDNNMSIGYGVAVTARLQTVGSTTDSSAYAFKVFDQALSQIIAVRNDGYTYFSRLTATTVPYIDASNRLVSSAVTPTELGLLSGITGFTGTGTLLAKGTSPVFTTDITTPLIIGGSAVGSQLTLKGTSGNGTSTVAAIVGNVGNNGATNAFNVYNSGQFSIGNYASPTNLRQFTVGQDTAFLTIGSLTSATSQSAIYMNQATPSSTNYSLTADSATTVLNGATSLALNVAAITRVNFAGVSASGSTTKIAVTQANTTNQTASTEVYGTLWATGTRQWATGAITTQREFYIQSPVYSFVGASTISSAYTLYVEAPTASTNATITNNYAAGFNGTIRVPGIVGSDTTNYTMTYKNTTGTQTSTGTCHQFLSGDGQILLSLAYKTITFSPSSGGSGNASSLVYSFGSSTGQTASTEISGTLYNAYSRQWATGAITTQREFYIKTVTYTAVGASTITNAYGMYVEAPTASTNITITNNWALGLSGNMFMQNASTFTSLQLTNSINTAGTFATLTSNSNNLYLAAFGTTAASTTFGLNRAGATYLYVDGGNYLGFGTTGSTPVVFATNNVERIRIISSGEVGIGVIAPSALLHLIKTTEQLRVGYDASNYLSATVNSTGVTTIASAGTDPSIKILNSAAHKLGFWNATPIVQPTTGVTAATFTANTSGIVDDTATFDGYTIGQVVKALRNTGILA